MEVSFELCVPLQHSSMPGRDMGVQPPKPKTSSLEVWTSECHTNVFALTYATMWKR